MTKVATKKGIDPDMAREFKLAKADITDVADFGSFELIKTKRGIMFKTHTGFHAWCTPYVLDLNGKAQPGSLWRWLNNLIEAKKEYEGHIDEPFPETENSTYGDILDYMKIVTEANMTIPATAFVDLQTATNLANERIQWLHSMQEKLSGQLAKEAEEETEEDIKANAEHDLNVIEREQIAEMLNNEE